MTICAHFSCGTSFSAIISTPTDVINITGSDTALIRILKIGISTTQTTTGINPWNIIKRSTANSGGISENPSIVGFDSFNSAATAIIAGYIEPPTLGNLIGSIKNFTLNSPSLKDDGIGAGFMLFNFTEMNIDPLLLRGHSESISINFLGASLPSGLRINAFVRWTEEA